MRTPNDNSTNFVAWLFGGSKRASEDSPDAEPAAKKQKTSNVEAEPEETVSILPADVMIITTDECVTMYSDPLRKRTVDGVTKFIGDVRADGGRFILLQGGATVVLESPSEIIHLVKKAHNDKIVTGKTPRKVKPKSREIENLVVEQEDNEHPALNLNTEATARTAPDDRFEMPSLGGTPFKPSIHWARVAEFVGKANKLKQKSEEGLYNLISELDDAEDSVHLFRNFCDAPKISGRLSGKAMVVNFSQREIDLLVYSEIHNVEREYTWNLMPYRDRKSLFGKFKGVGGNKHFLDKIDALKEDEDYVKHLNEKISLLFRGGEE
jgi:hypothetical protein